MPSSFLIQHYPAGICWHNLIRDHKMLTKFSTDTELGMCLGWSSTAKKKTSLAGVDWLYHIFLSPHTYIYLPYIQSHTAHTHGNVERWWGDGPKPSHNVLNTANPVTNYKIQDLEGSIYRIQCFKLCFKLCMYHQSFNQLWCFCYLIRLVPCWTAKLLLQPRTDKLTNTGSMYLNFLWIWCFIHTRRGWGDRDRDNNQQLHC